MQENGLRQQILDKNTVNGRFAWKPENKWKYGCILSNGDMVTKQSLWLNKDLSGRLDIALTRWGIFSWERLGSVKTKTWEREEPRRLDLIDWKKYGKRQRKG